MITMHLIISANNEGKIIFVVALGLDQVDKNVIVQKHWLEIKDLAVQLEHILDPWYPQPPKLQPPKWCQRCHKSALIGPRKSQAACLWRSTLENWGKRAPQMIALSVPVKTIRACKLHINSLAKKTREILKEVVVSMVIQIRFFPRQVF